MSLAYSEHLNRGRFETWTKKPDMPFLHVTQVHGTDIVSIETLPCEADGIVISWENNSMALAIKTADCLPIVIEGSKGVVFLHAGWKGLSHGILEQSEIAMIEPERVFIGPSIHRCCFEVSEDFMRNFLDSPLFSKEKGKLYFDLQQEAKRLLLKKFPGLLIDIAPICTSCNEIYHSFRRTKTKERNWNLYIKG